MYQSRVTLIILALFFSSFFYVSCSYDSEEELFEGDCGLIENMSLQEDIAPILQANCYTCHASDIATAGVDLESYTSLKTLSENGLLLGAINHQQGFAAMPPSGEMLDECNIKKIETWINEGIQNN